MAVSVIFKGIVIAFFAALAAWIPIAGLMALEVDVGLIPSYSALLLPLAMLGSYAIGLPISLLVYFLAGPSLTAAPGIVFLMANLAGAMMTLTGFFLAERSGMMLLGLPAWLAANVFALLGWLWILKPRTAVKE